MTDDCRKAFEMALYPYYQRRTEYPYSPEQLFEYYGETGRYRYGDVQESWELWQAARRAGPEPTKDQPDEAAWEDAPDQWSETIAQAHPTITGKHKTYEKALEMVSNRHSKGSLVDLVNWLLAYRRPTEAAPLSDDAVAIPTGYHRAPFNNSDNSGWVSRVTKRGDIAEFEVIYKYPEGPLWKPSETYRFAIKCAATPVRELITQEELATELADSCDAPSLTARCLLEDFDIRRRGPDNKGTA